MSLIIREMQIKTIMRYHLTPAKMATINKLTNTSASQDVGKREPYTLLMEVQTGAATVENRTEFPPKLKIELLFV